MAYNLRHGAGPRCVTTTQDHPSVCNCTPSKSGVFLLSLTSRHLLPSSATSHTSCFPEYSNGTETEGRAHPIVLAWIVSCQFAGEDNKHGNNLEVTGLGTGSYSGKAPVCTGTGGSQREAISPYLSGKLGLDCTVRKEALVGTRPNTHPPRIACW